MPPVLNRAARVRRFTLLGLFFGAALYACGREVAGPGADAAVRFARGLSFQPTFPPAFQAAGASSAGVVAFTRVRVLFRHLDASLAADTVVDFPGANSALTLSLSIPLSVGTPPSGEVMNLYLAYINAAGDTVFRGGPVQVTVFPSLPGSPPPPPVSIPVSYTGVGFNAVNVVASPRTLTVFSGDAFSFAAIAHDASAQAIPGTPVVWTSLDPTHATISAPAAGSGVALGQRGTARIVAQLLTGPADTVIVNVILHATAMTIQSGNAQAATVTTALPLPLVVKVAAADGIGVAGVPVTFAVTSGNGSVTTANAVSDTNGLAQTHWTLGAVVGTQTVTATAATLTNSPLTFTATGQAAFPSRLIVTAQPQNGVAGTVLPAVTVAAADSAGNIVPAFTGPVTIALGNNPGAATLGGTLTVNAVAGVATFQTLTVNRNGTAYTLVASATGLASATSSSFNIVVGPTVKLAFTALPAGALAGAAFPSNVQVTAEDSQGNATPSFTGTVTLGFATNPASATLGGTLTASAIAGVATFPSISISLSGTGYQLSATATGLTAATSAAFIVGASAAPATQLKFSTQPTNAIAGAVITPAIVVTARDASNNVAGTYTGPITLSFGANPGVATLGGTATVSAVGGVATFNNITVSKPGVAYTLNANSGTLAPDVSVSFNLVIGAATTMAIAGGNLQNGLVSTPLPTALQVLVTDAFANPVPGVTVNWAVTGGGGSVSSPSSVSNASGVAAVIWTMGSTISSQTVTAASVGLTGSPLTFAATSSSTAANKMWTGSTNNQWTTPTNWSPAGVPTATDSVQLVPITNQPQLATNTTVASLSLSAGAILTLSGGAVLTDNGILNAVGTITGAGSVALAGTARTVKGTIGVPLTVSGTYTLAGPINVTGNVAVTAGSLVFGGQSLTVSGAFSTTGAGAITMTGVTDSLFVGAGGMQFQGGTSTLTNGYIQNAGPTQQTGAAGAFSATALHTTKLTGAGGQAINFAAPAAGFGKLVVTGSADLQTGVTVHGDADVQLGATIQTLTGYGRLTVNGNVIARPGSAAPGGIIRPKVVEIGGVLADSGTFNPDTAVFFGGTTPSPQIIPDTTSPGVGPTYKSIRVSGIAKMEPTGGRSTGGYFLSGGLVITGTLNIDTNTTASSISVGDSLVTHGSGVLNMTNGGTQLTVSGHALFAGGPSVLNNGTLTLLKNFTQASGSNNFAASGLHITRLAGSSATGGQVISFNNPGTGGAGSHFANLVNANDGVAPGLTLSTDVYADGVLSMSVGSTDSVSFYGTNVKLVAQGASIAGGNPGPRMVFNGVELVLTDGATFTQADGLTFRNFSATGVNFEFARNTGTYTLQFLRFENAALGGNLLDITGTSPNVTLKTPLLPDFLGWLLNAAYSLTIGALLNVLP